MSFWPTRMSGSSTAWPPRWPTARLSRSSRPSPGADRPDRRRPIGAGRAGRRYDARRAVNTGGSGHLGHPGLGEQGYRGPTRRDRGARSQRRPCDRGGAGRSGVGPLPGHQSGHHLPDPGAAGAAGDRLSRPPGPRTIALASGRRRPSPPGVRALREGGGDPRLDLRPAPEATAARLGIRDRSPPLLTQWRLRRLRRRVRGWVDPGPAGRSRACCKPFAPNLVSQHALRRPPGGDGVHHVTGRMRRVRDSLRPSEWRRVGGMAATVVGLTVAGSAMLMAAVPHHYHVGRTELFGVGTGILAYTLGMRHAFDAAHISAIDNTTRKLMAEGKRPLSVGFWFSLGHSSVVFALAVLLNLGIRFLDSQVKNDSSGLHHWTTVIGTSVSGTFLYLIAVLNLVILVSITKVFLGIRRGHYDDEALELQLEQRGLMNRLLGPLARKIDAPWKMYPIGLLFGLGFDTATEVALLVLSGTAMASGLR